MGRNLPFLAVCVGVVQAAFYYLVAATVRGDGSLAIAQPDTMLYCQAARRIVEGAPFSFSVGTAASTGTTSVLYPFILAVPYALGCVGDGLLAAGFLLNAAFYLAFLLGWALLACRVFADRPAACGTAVALLALSGPFAYCALAQSDTGLWMAVSAWLAYGLFTGRRGVYGPLLLLAPWVRPEGMVVVAACCLFGAVDAARRRRCGPDATVLAAAAASALGVFALNYLLTGACQFSSVARKGFFSTLSFPSAVYAAAIDAMRIAKAYLFGLPQRAPRDFFCVPAIGAAFLWIGVFTRPWRDVSWRELAWYLAMAGGMATVAVSGWQNTNLDRYLVWLLPVLLLYMASGADAVALRLRPGTARRLPAAVLVGFSCVMAPVFVWMFRFASAGADTSRAFIARCEAAMPPGASLGSWGDAGVSYSLSARRLAHLPGIYSPEFDAASFAAKVEILKNEPETRFDYWFSRVSDHASLYCEKPEVVAGETVISGPPDFELRKADWSAYDAAKRAPAHVASNLTLCAHVDVAYEKDEKTCGYEAFARDGYPLFAPFHVAGQFGGTNIVEGGRFLLGGDAMTVPLQPGREVHVVMRTALNCKVSVDRELGHRASEFALKSPMTLKVLVDGEEAGDIAFPVAEGDFADAHFVIPGKFITAADSRLAFLGEHVAFAYWFYQ